ncbi:MAG: sigma-E factor negative regulatory protein [Betaproteobacteria bacterium]|nr:sigma-E factor negative regulatory protein [Betaproteobacteria bacterium]
MKKETLKEQLSAMLDGELDDGELDRVLRESECFDLCEEINIYFLIRDVLQERDTFLGLSCNLTRIIRERLKSETYLSIDLDESDHLEKKKELSVNM